MRFSHALTILAAIVLFAFHASGQSTQFTYQGDLKSNGTAASGLHDFRFRLFDAASGGAAIGNQLCVDNVTVTDGKFTTTIDFGSAFATTAGRFLEIEVRRDTGLGCGNASGFVTLTPRQPITPAPRATAASVANALGSPNGTTPNAVIVDNNANIGIGTSTPGHSVTIAKPAPTLALQDSDSTGATGGQQVGYLSYRDSANVERGWVGYGTAGSPVFSVVNARQSGHIALLTFNGGNVGIGTTAPAATLDVRGDIRLGSSGQLEAVAGEERLRTIRGSVNWNGAILRGRGFTSTRVNEGDYLITFTTPFSDVPTVTANVDDVTDSITLFHYYVAGVFATTTNSVRIRVRGHSSSTFPNGRIDQPFHFIVVGPR